MRQVLMVVMFLVWVSSIPVWAEEAASEPATQVVVHLDVMSVSPAAAAGLHPSGRQPVQQWQSLIASGQARVIQTLDYLSMSGARSTMLIGHKDPLVFYDPKAQQFQIQYVDVGLKLQTTIDKVTPDTVGLEVQPDFSLLQVRRPYGAPPEPLTYPQTSTVQANLRIDGLHFDEGVVLARSHGPLSKTLWSLLGPPASLTPGNDLVIVVAVRRP